MATLVARHPLVSHLRSGRRGVLFFFFVGLIKLVTFAPFARNLWQREYDRSPNFHGALQASFSADNVVLVHPQGTSTIRWTAYNRYLLDDELLVLVQPPNFCHIFPRRAFDRESWEKVEGWVREKLSLAGP